MARMKMPEDAPPIGTALDVVEGPADGKVVAFTGTQLVFAEVANPAGYQGRPEDPPDTDQLRRQHCYVLREIEHLLTGEKRWVYWFDHTE